MALRNSQELATSHCSTTTQVSVMYAIYVCMYVCKLYVCNVCMPIYVSNVSELVCVVRVCGWMVCMEVCLLSLVFIVFVGFRICDLFKLNANLPILLSLSFSLCTFTAQARLVTAATQPTMMSKSLRITRIMGSITPRNRIRNTFNHLYIETMNETTLSSTLNMF